MYRRICALSLACFVVAAVSSGMQASANDQRQIRVITWIVHPYCWSIAGDNVPAGQDPKRWRACLTWERENHVRYKKMISAMKTDEAVVIFPIGSSEPMQDLKEYAKKTLGDRCVILQRSSVDPDFLLTVKDPIRRFLNDPELPGRKEWLRDILTSNGQFEEPPGVAAELEKELREACSTIGFDWRPQALEVLYYSRLIADEIEQAFRSRKLAYDPETVACTAVGEGFEQCAMTWKGMLSGYIGFANPIENEAKLSVTGEPNVVFGTFVERVELADDIRLFLWSGPKGAAVALLTRASFRWRDPQLFATVSLKGLDLEVSRVEVNQIQGQRANQISTITLGPRLDASPAFQPDRDHLRVPIFTGSRKGGDHAYYLVAPGVDHSTFRQRLITAPISEKAAGESRPLSRQTIRVGDTLYLSAQGGESPDTGAATRQAMTNLKRNLESEGFKLSDVVAAQVWLTDLGKYSEMNAAYRSFFKAGFPTRTTLGVAALPGGSIVQIALTAVKGPKKVIDPAGALKIGLPFSPGILAGDTLYLSGQVGVDYKTGKLVEGDIGAHVVQTLKNIQTVLKAADMDFSNVVSAYLYMKNADDFGDASKAYLTMVTKEPRPARLPMSVAALPLDSPLEITMIASRKSRKEVRGKDQPPSGAYSRGLLNDNVLYMAGVFRRDGTMAEQVDSSLEWLKAILDASGMGLEDVVEVRVYLADLADYDAMTKAYQEHFSSKPPTLAVAIVPRLPAKSKIMMGLVAAKPK